MVRNTCTARVQQTGDAIKRGLPACKASVFAKQVMEQADHKRIKVIGVVEYYTEAKIESVIRITSKLTDPHTYNWIHM